MKKIIATLLFVLLLLTFVGCKDDRTPDDTNSMVSQYVHETNIYDYAKKGEIPEVPFKLGESVEKVKKNFKDTIPEGSEIEDLIITEGTLTVQMDGGNSMFFYEKANEKSGIGLIVAKEEAFKLSMGGVYSAQDIIDMIELKDYNLGTATDADVFFLPGDASNYECLSYNVGDYVLKFIIIDGYVSAATLTNPAVWNY